MSYNLSASKNMHRELCSAALYGFLREILAVWIMAQITCKDYSYYGLSYDAG